MISMRKKAAAVASSALMIAVGLGAASAQAATDGGDFTAKLACPSSGKISSTHSCTSLSGGGRSPSEVDRPERRHNSYQIREER